MRAATVLGDGDLVIRPSAIGAGGQVVEIGEDVAFPDGACVERDLDLADVADGRGPAVHEQPRPAQQLVVALALTSLTSLAVAGFLCWAFAG